MRGEQEKTSAVAGAESSKSNESSSSRRGMLETESMIIRYYHSFSVSCSFVFSRIGNWIWNESITVSASANLFAISNYSERECSNGRVGNNKCNWVTWVWFGQLLSETPYLLPALPLFLKLPLFCLV